MADVAPASGRAVRSPGGGPPLMIDALTGIRAIAAVWVLLAHLRIMLGKLFPGFEALDSLATAGFLGLEVFFVLSGFIISHNYAERLAARRDRHSYRDFMAARIARTYPVHLLTTLLALALAVWVASRHGTAIEDRFGVGTFLVNLVAMQGIGPVAFNVPAWSVSLEIVYYLIFPFVAWRLVRTGARASAVAAGVLLVLIAVVPIPLGVVAYQPVGTWVRLAAEFAAGALAWRVWRAWATPHRRWDAVAVGCAVAVTAISLTVPREAIFVAVPFLVVGLVAVASSTGPVRAFLAARPVEWGGRISYSFYLTHVLVLYAIWEYYPPALYVGASLPVRAGYVVVHLALILGVAALTYHLVEERSRSWLRRRLSGPRPPAAAEAVSTAPTAPLEVVTGARADLGTVGSPRAVASGDRHGSDGRTVDGG